MAKRSVGEGRLYALAALACLAPLVVLVSALLTRSGAISMAVGYDLVVLTVGRWIALLGLAAALILVVLAMRTRRGWLPAAVALTVSLATLGGYVWQSRKVATLEDVSTDLAEPPGFGVLADSRTGQVPQGGPVRCEGAAPVMTQALPEVVVYHMQAAGAPVRRAGVTGVYGAKRGVWFGSTFDVAVRIRPGRTDIRVAARDRRNHGGEACRLAAELSERLRRAHRL